MDAWLSDAQDRVETAQRVLAGVDRGLVAVERVERTARRARPVLRTLVIVALGCLLALGVAVLAGRRRSAPADEHPGSDAGPDTAAGPPRAGGMRAAVTLHIGAPPVEVWDLVSDITKMGEYSPEVVEAEWLDGATGPAVGARYRGHVKRNESWPVLYWTTCRVTESVPGEVFEFAVIMGDRPVNTWRYEFRATEDGGTEVTESFELADHVLTRLWRPLGGVLRERRNQRDMLRTLERVKAVAERPAGGHRAGR